MKTKYKNWTLIDWDGNPALGYKCYRKSFRNGHVSVGVGKFELVCFSYGADSEDSIACTRWRNFYIIPELMVMAKVDENKGYYNSQNNW